jgi:hypothetical protein
VDQLERMGAIENDDVENIRSLLSSYDDVMSKGGNNRLSRKISSISLEDIGRENDAFRIQALLKENLKEISEKLRRR